MSGPHLKTYSHLAGRGRIPNDYDIATSKLLYHPTGGFEVESPIGEWYDRHQRGSLLASDRWEEFRDPRETTYSKYVALQAERSIQLEETLRMIEETGYDQRLDGEWVRVLDRMLGPSRFLWHAFQMLAAYIGQLAPAGRIAIVCAQQAADEMRRVHAVAYRMALLARARPRAVSDGRARWEKEPAWQPIRRAVEQALVTWDFGEALVALDLCLKPLCDVALLELLPEAAQRRGDHLLATLLFNLNEDARWQRAATASLLQLVLSEREANRAAVSTWLSRWLPQALEGAAALAPLLDDSGGSFVPHLRRRAATWFDPLGLDFK